MGSDLEMIAERCQAHGSRVVAGDDLASWAAQAHADRIALLEMVRALPTAEPERADVTEARAKPAAPDAAEFAELLREADDSVDHFNQFGRVGHASMVARLAAALRKVLKEKREAEENERSLSERLDSVDRWHADLCNAVAAACDGIVIDLDTPRAEHVRQLRAEVERAKADLTRERSSHERLIDVIAQETHAVGISETMTPEERVSAVCKALAREREAKPEPTHTARKADDRVTLCGKPREPAALDVPATDGVTCVACLQEGARIYFRAEDRNLKDAIAHRERAERAEEKCVRIEAERDGFKTALENTEADLAREREAHEETRRKVADCEADHKPCTDCGTMQNFIGQGLFECWRCTHSADLKLAREVGSETTAALMAARAEVERLSTTVLRVCQALGCAHEADGHIPEPADEETILRSINHNVERGERAEAEVERLKAELTAEQRITSRAVEDARIEAQAEMRSRLAIILGARDGEGVEDAADRLRAQLEAMPNYARAIGEIEAAVGIAGDVPLSDTVAAVARLRAQLAQLELVKVDAEALGRVLYMTEGGDSYSWEHGGPEWRAKYAEKAVAVAQAFARAMLTDGAIDVANQSLFGGDQNFRDETAAGIRAALAHAGLHVAAEAVAEKRSLQVPTVIAQALGRSMLSDHESGIGRDFEDRLRELGEPVAEGRACPVEESTLKRWDAGGVLSAEERRDKGMYVSGTACVHDVNELAIVVSHLVDEVRRLGGGGR